MTERNTAPSGRKRQQALRPEWERRILRDLGAKIRAQRKEAGFTLATLASMAGLDAAFLGELERGRANVSVTNLIAVARALSSASILELTDHFRESS